MKKIKTTKYYCSNCLKEYVLPNNERHWCDCNNPPFTLYLGTVKEGKQLERNISAMFSTLGKRGGSKSKRILTPEQAKEMVRIRELKRNPTPTPDELGGKDE